MTRAEAFRVGSAGLFLISVFYGYVWIGVTLPLSMLVLPLVFVAYFDRDVVTNIPRGALLLLGMTIPVGLQALAGRPLQGKTDAVVFLSVVYAVATVITLPPPVQASMRRSPLPRARNRKSRAQAYQALFGPHRPPIRCGHQEPPETDS